MIWVVCILPHGHECDCLMALGGETKLILHRLFPRCVFVNNCTNIVNGEYNVYANSWLILWSVMRHEEWLVLRQQVRNIFTCLPFRSEAEEREKVVLRPLCKILSFFPQNTDLIRWCFLFKRIGETCMMCSVFMVRISFCV